MALYEDSELAVERSATKDLLVITISQAVASRVNRVLGYYPQSIAEGEEPLFHITLEQLRSLKRALGLKRFAAIQSEV
jgi:hypothetical protein